MKNYLVEIPVLATINVEIEANSKEEAIEKAISNASFSIKTNNSENNEGYIYELTEWDIYKEISKGNFYYGHIHEASAEEI